MKFYSAYNVPPVLFSPTGERVKPVYKLVTDEETGKSKLVEVDKTNVYDAIQSYSSACDLTTRLAMYANGDKNALTGGRGVYCDLTGVPRSFVEAQRQAINADSMYNSLPDEVRSAFGSFSEFRNEYVKGTLDSTLNAHLNNINAQKNAALAQKEGVVNE